MKKMNVLISTLALTMAMLTPVTSYAAEGFTNDKDDMEVSQSYAVSYVVTIPDGTDKLQEGSDFKVSAEAFIKYGSVLTVAINSTNDWELRDAVYSENKATVPYKMAVGGENVENGDAILTMDHTDKTGNVTLVVSEMGDAEYAGTYKDTLTFSIGLTEAEADAAQ